MQYRPAAIADIRNASDYIADVLKNRSAANRFKAKILEGVSLLKDNPYMGTPLASKYDVGSPIVGKPAVTDGGMIVTDFSGNVTKVAFSALGI